MITFHMQATLFSVLLETHLCYDSKPMRINCCEKISRFPERKDSDSEKYLRANSVVLTQIYKAERVYLHFTIMCIRSDQLNPIIFMRG